MGQRLEDERPKGHNPAQQEFVHDSRTPTGGKHKPNIRRIVIDLRGSKVDEGLAW